MTETLSKWTISLATLCLFAFIKSAFSFNQHFNGERFLTIKSLNSLSNEENGDSGIFEEDNVKGFWSRRKVFNSLLTSALSLPLPSVASVPSSTDSKPIIAPKFAKEESWPLGKVAFSLLPLAGTSSRRATVMETIVPDQIWTFDQLQGVVNVNVPVRM